MKLINKLKKMAKRPSSHKTKPAAGTKTHPYEGVEIFQYLDPDGKFDYEKYKQIQIAGNKRKINSIWAIEENISFISDYISRKIGKTFFGICHGTRTGKEQLWFRKSLGCEVIGTEISDTATNFPYTIQWDFHETKPEWIESADFIYSNSFDHSYDPEKCLNAWMSCLKKSGICIIEHSNSDETARELDPFGANIVALPYLVLIWGKGQFVVKEIIDAPSKHEFVNYTHFLIIQKS